MKSLCFSGKFMRTEAQMPQFVVFSQQIGMQSKCKPFKSSLTILISFQLAKTWGNICLPR